MCYMVAYCVGRVHNMLFEGARCVGSTLWLNNAPLIIDHLDANAFSFISLLHRIYDV